MLQISVAIKACKELHKQLPHTLFSGSAGCGKTTTANYISDLMGTNLIQMSPVGAGDLTNLSKVLIASAKKHRRFPMLFIDEIHHLTVRDQEMIGTVMEKFLAPVKIGAAASETEIRLPPFTLIGATTDPGKLLKPFRDRFKLVFTFNDYTEEEALDIAKIHADRLNIKPSDEQLHTIVKLSRRVPRKIVTMLESYKNFSIVFGDDGKSLDNNTLDAMIKAIGIQPEGLTDQDISLLKALEANNSPVGLDTLAALINEGPNTIRNSLEPYLLQKGFIQRSQKGRVLTDKGLEYLYKYNFAERTSDFNVANFDFLE